MLGRFSPVIFGVTALYTLFIVLLIIPTSEGRDIHVDKDDADPTVQLGTAEFPYDSIQEAVQVAMENDIIYMHASDEIYEEKISLSNSDSLTIIGDSVDDVTVRAQPEESVGISITTSGNVIEGLTIMSDIGTEYGIRMNAQNNEFHHCRFLGFDTGIQDEGSGIENSYHHLFFKDCSIGIVLYRVRRCSVYENTFTNCNYTMRVYGEEAEEYDHFIAENNTMDGKPTLYYRNLSHETVIFSEMNHSFLGFFDCDNLTIKKTTVTGLYDGLLIANCRDIEIFDSTFEDNVVGIHVTVSGNIFLHDVDAVGNLYYQIYFRNSDHIRIENIEMSDISLGIDLDHCTDSTLDTLDIASSETSLFLDHSTDIIIRNSDFSGSEGTGSIIWWCDRINFMNCRFSGFDWGIWVRFSHDFIINITESQITNCGIGIYAEESDFAIISSEFESNTQDIYLSEGTGGGTWYNSTALDTAIDRDKIGMDDNCSLLELHYLTVTVEDENSDPIGGAEVFIRSGIGSGGEVYTVYDTPLYGGEDPLTPLSGVIGPVPVGANRYTNGSMVSFVTWVNTSYGGEEEMLELFITGPTTEDISLSVMANRPPEVQITTPNNGTKVSGAITISGTATDPNGDDTIEFVEVRIDEGSWKKAVGTMDWEFELDTTAFSDGTHTVSARAYDGELHSPVATIDITLANDENLHEPVVVITSPGDGDEVSGVVIITGTASDDDGDGTIHRVEVSIDDGAWEEADGTDEWEYRFDSTILSEGSHTVSVRAFDGTHTSDIQIITLEVNNHGGENTPPEILNVSLSSPSVRAGNVLTISGAIRDLDGEDDIPTTGVTITLSDNTNRTLVTFTWPTIVITEATEENTLLFNLTLETPTDWEGTYHLWLSVEDAGGEHVERSLQFTVEKKSDDSDDQVFDWVEDDVLFFGIIPALIIIPLALLIAFVTMRKRKQETEGEGEGGEGGICPTCGTRAEYVEEYDSSYCWNCEEYL